MITMNNVIKEGNDLLHKKCEDVKVPLSKEDETLLLDMMNYIYESVKEENENNPLYRGAVGLAAPQVGVLKKMIAIVAPDEKGYEYSFAMVNPKIRSYSDELTYLEGGEGCLSVDRKVAGLIHRPKKITVETYLLDEQTKELKYVTLKLKGYLAVVFQHEYDHLNGILFVDRIDKANPFKVPENSKPIVFK